MTWLRVSVLCPADGVEPLNETLDTLGALAVTLEDASGGEESGDRLEGTVGWDVTRVSGLFHAGVGRDALLAALDEGVAPARLGPVEVEEISERDWSTAWSDGLAPLRFGRRLWVCPTWCEAPGGDALTVRLDPGLAFGTGSHPTTALCLEHLAAADLDGVEVVDYGCGSGVLAIAAARLGAGPVWAVDDDPAALAVAGDNAAANRIADRVRVVAPDGLPPVEAGLLAANILANPLIALAPRFARLVRAGGSVVLSGLLANQESRVSAAYAPWFELGAGVTREGWLLIEGRRRHGQPGPDPREGSGRTG